MLRAIKPLKGKMNLLEQEQLSYPSEPERGVFQSCCERTDELSLGVFQELGQEEPPGNIPRRGGERGVERFQPCPLERGE